MPDKRVERMSDDLREFIRLLGEKTGDLIPARYVQHTGGTYEIEADHFTLTFIVNSKIFEIRSSNVRGNAGFGNEIIEAIHEYADESGLDVIASRVCDTAQGFWEEMGYQMGSEEGEYFRAR